jgi:SAM-dependent methyltransferase
MVKPLFYDEDLAYIHDSGFTDLARSAATTLLGALRKQKIRNGLVVDLGCGSGVLAERLTGAGYEVLGIDVSPAMLKIARRRAPRARFLRRSLFDLEIPGCVAVTAIGESLNYIFDNRGPSGLNSLFTRIHHALMPGGLLIFDLAGPGRGSKNPIVHTIGKHWAIPCEQG